LGYLYISFMICSVNNEPLFARRLQLVELNHNMTRLAIQSAYEDTNVQNS
jgi:hypothetical protein